MPDRDTTILGIANALLGIGSLDVRNSDRLDFHEIGVTSLREALEAAYEAGQRAGKPDSMAVRAILLEAAEKALAHAQEAARDEGGAAAATARARYAMALLGALEAVSLYVDQGNRCERPSLVMAVTDLQNELADLRQRRDDLLRANNAEVERRRRAEAKVRDLTALLGDVATILEGAQRAGGPSQEDLDDLDTAVRTAVFRILPAIDTDFAEVDP